MKTGKNDKRNNISIWECKRWYQRWIDFPSLIIACMWGGILFLWPTPKDKIIPHYKSMVVAKDIKYSDVPMFRRPDIIALPSAISFSPDVDNKNDPMVLKKRDLPDSTLKESHQTKVVEIAKKNDVAIAAEAIRDVGKSCFDDKSISSLLSVEDKNNNGKGILVRVSGDIGDNAGLNWTDIDRKELFNGNKGWDVELSLSISKDGQPENVFLEEGSGDISIDRKIVRALSRHDIWKNVLPGYGTVLISFQ